MYLSVHSPIFCSHMINCDAPWLHSKVMGLNPQMIDELFGCSSVVSCIHGSLLLGNIGNIKWRKCFRINSKRKGGLGFGLFITLVIIML